MTTIKYLLLVLLSVGICVNVAGQDSSRAVIVNMSQELKRALKMNKEEYAGFKKELGMFADSVKKVMSNSSLKHEEKIQLIPVIQSNRTKFLQARLGMEGYLMFENFEKSLMELSVHRKYKRAEKERSKRIGIQVQTKSSQTTN